MVGRQLSWHCSLHSAGYQAAGRLNQEISPRGIASFLPREMSQGEIIYTKLMTVVSTNSNYLFSGLCIAFSMVKWKAGWEAGNGVRSFHPCIEFENCLLCPHAELSSMGSWI